jgi:Asp-tRNA(Asn)/Glu-tRNA(Gln) amidotransferase A subunit family amidase
VDFRTETVEGLAEAVRKGEITAVELAAHALAQIDARNGDVNAFVAVDAENALAEAARVDAARAGGEVLGPLAGVPVGVKDLEDAKGFVTSFGSQLHASDAPARRDSILVTRLREAGCVVIGKTNTPEHGCMADTYNAVFGPTRNPWDATRSPGGSSGGSAAAVAAGMVPLATGSDGGGSIRIPSSCCGLSGMKPSHGRVPTGGPEPPGWGDLSTRGLIARRIADVAYGLDAVIGPDPTDLRSLPMPEVSWIDAVREPHVPSRIAWSPTLGYAPVDPEVLTICENAISVLAHLGAEVDEVPRVFTEDPIGPWAAMTDSFNWRTVEHLSGRPEWDLLDPVISDSARRGERHTAAELARAMDECHRLNLRLVGLFHQYRLLVTPTLATLPPLSGSPGLIAGEPDQNWVRFTYPFNCTRSPAATVCAGVSASGLPVGLQLIGPQHADQVVLRAAAALEDALALPGVASLA